jgi:hypothetical protein
VAVDNGISADEDEERADELFGSSNEEAELAF